MFADNMPLVRTHFNFSEYQFVEGDLNSSRIVFFYSLKKILEGFKSPSTNMPLLWEYNEH